ncbi:hypothetical protein ABPG72_001987 [Tetrahymena utriculariae]
MNQIEINFQNYILCSLEIIQFDSKGQKRQGKEFQNSKIQLHQAQIFQGALQMMLEYQLLQKISRNSKTQKCSNQIFRLIIQHKVDLVYYGVRQEIVKNQQNLNQIQKITKLVKMGQFSLLDLLQTSEIQNMYIQIQNVIISFQISKNFVLNLSVSKVCSQFLLNFNFDQESCQRNQVYFIY